MKLDTYSITSNSVTAKLTLSNSIPTALNWKCSYIKYYGVRSQVFGPKLLEGVLR